MEIVTNSANDGMTQACFRMEIHMTDTLLKKIRVTPDQWDRIENAARVRGVSPNRMVVELALEALDRSDWPRTEAEIHLLRSALFTAQAAARTLMAEGRGDEIEQIRREISEIAPEPRSDGSNVLE